MSENKLNKQSIWFLTLAPLGIIFLGYLFTKDPREGNQKNTNNSIYTLWIAEAEVAEAKKDGSKWDVDATAPDLFALPGHVIHAPTAERSPEMCSEPELGQQHHDGETAEHGAQPDGERDASAPHGRQHARPPFCRPQPP